MWISLFMSQLIINHGGCRYITRHIHISASTVALFLVTRRRWGLIEALARRAHYTGIPLHVLRFWKLVGCFTEELPDWLVCKCQTTVCPAALLQGGWVSQTECSYFHMLHEKKSTCSQIVHKSFVGTFSTCPVPIGEASGTVRSAFVISWIRNSCALKYLI